MHPDAYKEGGGGSRFRAVGTVIWIVSTLALGAAVFVVILLATQRKEYSQATPEDVLASAVAMVRDGNSERIADLIYADSVEFRSTLTRLGALFGTMQDLGSAIGERFPAEVAAARENLKAELEGKQEGIVTALMSGQSEPIRFEQPRSAEERSARERQFQDVVTRLFADPFGMLDTGAARLSVERITDDTAVIKFDGQPVLGGVFAIKKHGDRWWLILPLNLPGVSAYAPQTRNEWAIIASLLKVIDNALMELAQDIRDGKAAGVEDVSRLAGEKAFIPAAIVFVMYGKEMDVRTRRESAMKQFRRRWGEFAKTRTEEPAVIRDLGDAAAKAAIEGLDGLIRKRTADREAVAMPRFDGMTADELIGLVEGWLRDAGGPLDLDAPLTAEQVQAARTAIEAKSKSGIRSRPAPLKSGGSSR